MAASKWAIQFDMDGVLAEFHHGFTQIGHRLFGAPIQDTYTQKDWHKYDGLTKKQINTIWREIEKSPSFWANLSSLVNDKTWARIRRLHDIADVYFVTARTTGQNLRTQTMLWLVRFNIFNPTVVFTADKAGFAEAVNITHAIDDKYENAYVTAQYSPAVSYLLDRQYNTGPDDGFTRIQTVDQFLDTVERDINAGHVDGRIAGDDGGQREEGETETRGLLAA